LRNWDKRQFVSDSSTARVREHRARVKQQCNVSVTPPDTDTDTDNITPPTPPKGEYTESFEKFWKQYPLKKGKGAAFRKWQQIAKKKTVTAGQLINAIILQVQSNHFVGKDGTDYIPNPATWLNQARWEDEIKSSCAQPEYFTGDNQFQDECK